MTNLAEINFESIVETLQSLNSLELETQASEAEILKVLIERIKPVIRYFDYPIATSYYQTKLGKSESRDLRGLLLVDDLQKPCSLDDQNRGVYHGSMLVLERSGELKKLEIFGNWSYWQGESSSWNTTISTISLENAIKEYEFTMIVEEIIKDIEKAIERSKNKKRMLQGRLIQLKQIKQILQ